MREKVYERLVKELELEGDLFFPEIERIFEEEKFEYKGNNCLLHPNNKNLIIWEGWNKEANNLIINILNEPKIAVSSCNSIEILLHSEHLNLPIAKGENYNYKKAHWFPAKLIWIK